MDKKSKIFRDKFWIAGKFSCRSNNRVNTRERDAEATQDSAIWRKCLYHRTVGPILT